MIPRHCADVGFKQVDFSLTENNLKSYFIGRHSYSRTKFYVVTNGGEWAVIMPEKKGGGNLFRTIYDMKLVSGPDRTRFVREPDLDVLHIRNLLKVQSKYPQDLVIIQGRFGHVSFVDVRLPARIAIVDVIPPKPSKLEVLLRDIMGEESSWIQTEIRYIDIEELMRKHVEGNLMLPCKMLVTIEERKASGKHEPFYLDSPPDLSDEEKESIFLIGCPLSERIFEELYGKRPKLVNICPREVITPEENLLPTISRCCKIRSGADMDEKGIFVPWGANLCDMAEALRLALSG